MRIIEVWCFLEYRQLSLKSPACKSWEAILGSRYFGDAKVVEEVVGGGRQQISWHSTTGAKKKRLMVTWSMRCKRC